MELSDAALELAKVAQRFPKRAPLAAARELRDRGPELLFAGLTDEEIDEGLSRLPA